ncbi:MAG: DUF4294 domain-containing protein [Bacteroidales bacterium]|nr:DUF4294 domain-containing protein [Bacteroidales bacterium]
MFSKLNIIIVLIFFGLAAKAQQPGVFNAKIFEGDTIPVVNLQPVYIVSVKRFSSKKEEVRYTRLVRYVKKVYPYAKLAANKLNEYEIVLKAAKNDKERSKIMKRAEKELRDEYEGKLRNFTITQGKILIKLIDRETRYSSYDLLKQLRSGLYAGIWQGVGKIFGYDLKVKYDPQGEDRQIEQIVQLIEAGAI